jgi:hypothetical protein
MRLRILLLLSLSAALLPLKATAQVLPPDEFFHAGAQFYISNNIPAALERVESGLKTYPDDVKLKKLEQLLKQQQQQSQQQNQQQQQEQKFDEQKQQEQSQAEQQKKEEQQQSAKSERKDESKEQQEAEQQQAQIGQMTEQQAKQLLDAQKGHEQVLIFKPNNEKSKARTKTLKDW